MLLNIGTKQGLRESSDESIASMREACFSTKGNRTQMLPIRNAFTRSMIHTYIHNTSVFERRNLSSSVMTWCELGSTKNLSREIVYLYHQQENYKQASETRAYHPFSPIKNKISMLSQPTATGSISTS